ncbi:MAG: SDR family NAD(P)-dependent oxidoreductase [Phycisphaerae bacterium]|jgi:sorbitol-6-phosphate 2-dehydrogenase|nr:SDR family NAD(P)-dependent oxidoreductase [Phycisphaerae bacterium]
MPLTDRERINIVAPATRAMAADEDILKLVRFGEVSAGAADGDSIVVELRDDVETPRQVVDQLRKGLGPLAQDVGAVTVKDLGTFHICRPAASTGRVAGKVAVVTGAAQGFGLEIARDLAAQGAVVVLADINSHGARDAAEEISGRLGPNRAIGLSIDVTDGASVESAFDQVVRTYGGLDVLVSNAGVLKAGSVKTQAEADFDLVAAVNYKGYFLCVQKAAMILAVQHLGRPQCYGDIIQINSKSGLVGSNRNAAYAGSKFGGIGLTQSFALELIADGIKVNSVCPGNFFDGPLWSDPENGLFAQYLQTGKVPGAKTVQDVRQAYEAKIPMGRGCTVGDVMKAIYYLIEQKYETGQAVPVTGGQVMLG